MGGLAIRHVIGQDANRISKDEYMPLFRDVVARIMYVDPKAHIYSPTPYWGKESHGDLDVIVSTEVENVCAMFHGIPFVKNDKCTSFAYSLNGKIVQVDIIRYGADAISAAKAQNMMLYMSNGNFGNLLGKMLHSYSFILSGEEGLVYQIRKGHVYPDITGGDYEVVLDTIITGIKIPQILDLVGVSRSLWTSGFKDNEAASQLVATSPYYNNSAFQEGSFRHADRVRERKRQAYEHIKLIPGVSTKTRLDLIEDVHSMRLWFKDRISQCITNHVHEKALTDRYNSMYGGHRVKELTGLDGVELGRFCSNLKSSYPKTTENAFMRSQKDVDEIIRFRHSVHVYE
jgi:hypothetical protein